MSDRFDPNDPFAGIEPYEEIPGGYDQPGRPHDPRSGEPPPRSPLLTGMVVGLLLVVASIALFQLFSSDGGDLGTATDTTLTGETTAAPGATSTTVPDGENTDATPADTDGTGAPSGEFEPYTGQGDPVPVEELTLASDGVGPIALGRPAAEAVGRLIASLGDPTDDTGPRPSSGEFGVCDEDSERIVFWGPFAAVIVVDPDATETFGGFRLDLSYGGFSNEAAELGTLSGIRLGDSFRNLQEIYDSFEVEEGEDSDLGQIWTVSSIETGNLLLWGPLAEGAVRGIYSPDACDRF